MAAYLLVIGDREALGWILAEQRMAFPSMSRPHVGTLATGDTLLLYTTRGCFRNPTKDRGRIIGEATSRRASPALDKPVSFGGRRFPAGCVISLQRLVPLGHGVEVVPLLDELDGIRSDQKAWAYQLRAAPGASNGRRPESRCPPPGHDPEGLAGGVWVPALVEWGNSLTNLRRSRPHARGR